MKRKKRSITLLEIMIVILLIGVIGGVLSYNLKGTLERGKVFRTEEGIRRLKEILDFEIERGTFTVQQLAGPDAVANVRKCVEDSGLIPQRDIDNFLKDGWKQPYSYTETGNHEVVVSSHHLEEYKAKHPEKNGTG